MEYSVNGQAGYCAVPYPPTWPALMQVPLTRRRAEPWRPAAAMLYTGQDAAAAAQLAGGLFGDGAPSAAERAAAQATLAAGEAAGTIYASGLSQLGLTLGTWRPVTDFMTYYLEPGFLQGENAEDVGGRGGHRGLGGRDGVMGRSGGWSGDDEGGGRV